MVKVFPYNPDWPLWFENEANLIKQVLGDNCIAIHHIGSTAVPGLAAKPIIDIIPVVRDIVAVDQANAAMAQAGFDAKGEYGILFRRFFQKRGQDTQCNVHIFEENHSDIERHLKFRDWMISHDDDRAAYAKLKQELALAHPNDILAYCFGKDTFVADIDLKAGAKGTRIVKALTPREWQTVRTLRQTYFFDAVPISDPYTYTFELPDHIHLVLYKDSVIVGYAHVQFWPEHRAALRIIVVDTPYRHQGLGSQFVKSIERWLKHQGFQQLHIQSSPSAYAFYQRLSYIKMPFNDPQGHESHPSDIDIAKIL